MESADRWKRSLLVFFYFSAITVTVYFFLYFFSTLYITREDFFGADFFIKYHPFSLLREAGFDWVPIPKTLIKAKLTFIDALLNSGAVFSAMSSFFLILLFGTIYTFIWTIPAGLFKGDWAVLIEGVITLIFLVIAIVLVPILGLGWWIMALFQKCTPGYFFTWLLFGLPCLLGGTASGPLVFKGATVIIFPE